MKTDTLIPAIVAVLFAGTLFSACGKSGANNDKSVQPVNVRIEVVAPQQLMDNIQVAGTVKAFEDVNMSPEEGGVVKEWKAVKGQSVKKGDLIVVLKDEMLKAGWDAAQAQYNMAELNLKMQQKVYEEKGISELQYKNIEYTRDAAKANADLMKARWQHTQLRSPVDGVVDNTIPNVGDFVPPGVPVARIVNMSVVKIQAEVPELYSGTIPAGIPAVITFDALPGDTVRAKVTFVGSTVSAMNRTLAVEIVAPNRLAKLKPEMVAKVRLLRETKTNAVLVSENLVQLVDRERTIVYVENQGKAVERQLKLGGRQGNKVEVLHGLNVGERLIVSGQQKLVDGSPVIVTQ
ncbi:MAG TPA: efflux RND transporter periplasmic adaptor subunit [Bacteroidota bacterium]